MMHFKVLAIAESTINNLNMSAEVVPTHRMAFAYPIWRHHTLKDRRGLEASGIRVRAPIQ
jgi:hypothetical protein